MMSILKAMRAGYIEASNKVFSLPIWLKIVVSINCAIPSFVMWLQWKHLALQRVQLLTMLPLVRLISSTPDFGPVLGAYIEAGAPVIRVFMYLILLNFVMAVIGCHVFVMLWFRSKAKAPVSPASNEFGDGCEVAKT